MTRIASRGLMQVTLGLAWWMQPGVKCAACPAQLATLPGLREALHASGHSAALKQCSDPTAPSADRLLHGDLPRGPQCWHGAHMQTEALLMVSFPPMQEAEALRDALSAQHEEAALAVKQVAEQTTALRTAGFDSLPEVLAAIERLQQQVRFLLCLLVLQV